MRGGTRDLTGQVFGKLTVLRRGPNSSCNHVRWICQCSCGGPESIHARGTLVDSKVQSCGCIHQAQRVANMRLSGQRRTAAAEKWRAVNPGIAALKFYYHNYKSRAKRHALLFTLTFEEFQGIVAQSCIYCGNPPGNTPAASTRKCKRVDTAHASGIDRIDSAAGYTLENVVPCCIQCNKAKNAYALDDFIDWVRRVEKHTRDWDKKEAANG